MRRHHATTDFTTMNEPTTIPQSAAGGTHIEAEGFSVFYRAHEAVRQVGIRVARGLVTAIIGPSGCGKSTFLRAINRMNDLIPGCRVAGALRFDGEDVYGDKVDASELRRRIGMVFQKPNPFPKSIYDNVAYGPRLHGRLAKGDLDDIVESSLRDAALWDEVKDRLHALGSLLSGGQQQRLTIARALSQDPDLLMLDEFSIAVDPVTTMRIEDVLKELRKEVTIILVTNLVQQARRLADRTAFFLNGECVEVGVTEDLFTGEVKDQRTRDYVEGRFG